MKAGEAMRGHKGHERTGQNCREQKKVAYHLIMRGDDRKKVFGDDKDYKKFLSLVQQSHAEV